MSVHQQSGNVVTSIYNQVALKNNRRTHTQVKIQVRILLKPSPQVYGEFEVRGSSGGHFYNNNNKFNSKIEKKKMYTVE